MKKKLKSPKPKPFLAALSASSGPSLIRHLASSNASVRYESLRLIQSWLSASSVQLTDDEMMRLWKGLFYCLWHSDKAPAQAQLISRLSSLLLTLNPLLSLQYFSVFLVTLRREWNGIDHLRLDKFYLLIRRFVNGMFCLMGKHKWDLEYLQKYVEVLETKALLCEDKSFGNGVNYHLVSVFLDELKGFSVPLSSKEVVECLIRPFVGVMRSSLDKVLVAKVKSCFFDALLRMGRGLLGNQVNATNPAECGKGELLLGKIALAMNFSTLLYEAGSAADCVQGNRKINFELHEAFLRLEKELKASGIDIEHIVSVTGVGEDDDGEEVPELIPISNGKGEDLGVAESLVEKEGSLKKKKKKAKQVADKKDKKKKKKQKKEKNGVPGDGLSFDKTEIMGSDKCLENENLVDADVILDAPNSDASSSELKIDETEFDFNEAAIANLHLQFEKVAAEMGFDKAGGESSESPVVASKKKRKIAKSMNSSDHTVAPSHAENELGNGVNSSDKSSKRVRFAMKDNLIWKPQSPLPPQSLRIPPSVTPRGSALKKGVPPGPVREISPALKKAKLKKGRKILKTVSPAPKRLRKVKVVSV